MRNSKLRRILIIELLLAVVLTAALIYVFSAHKQREVSEKCEQVALSVGKTIEETAEINGLILKDVAAEFERSRRYARIYAHRGIAGEQLEHSFAAYDYAISKDVTNIELDVVRSASGTLYLSHDDNSYRLTGKNRNCGQLTDEQIDSMTTYKGNHILKLAEVFERYGDSVTYIIELKDDDPETTEEFIRTVDQYDLEKKVIVQCFGSDALRAVEEDYPDMQKILLCKTWESFNEGLSMDFVDTISVKSVFVNAANCDAVHDAGKQFSAWTLNTDYQIRNAIDIGVDTYFTDSLDTAIAIEDELRSKTDQICFEKSDQ